MKITRNLKNAINYLFEHNQYVLWIDAICIDQANVRERGDQVGLMCSVYTRAKKVTVWLGPKSFDSDLAMDLLTLLAQGVDKQNREAWVLGLAEPQYYHAWVALQHLLRRNWWKRAWVIQEVALAQSIEIACGNRRISETQVMQAQQILTEDWYIIFPTDVIQSIKMTSRDL